MCFLPALSFDLNNSRDPGILLLGHVLTPCPSAPRGHASVMKCELRAVVLQRVLVWHVRTRTLWVLHC